ncbi:tobamovirus multiplication protein 1 [Impatiens glandulifera]|uniref:tobamovirus multiplication protein 1 n=1 Tax=Impatiens glandulifera TaxID=253017 RepID=UPI001FB1986B|nr:tobamovirus multiplication protein 1 [Impatiens glandulifera]
MLMLELRDGDCYPKILVAVNIVLACIDASIAVLAFSQLIRIHSRSSNLGWTRQKVFHLLIGASNIGYLLYFVVTLVAACNNWVCWSHSCGFIFMACPKILFLAAFLLLLSFWIDLCHQPNDDEDEEEEYSSQETLLEGRKDKPYSNAHSWRKCCSFRAIHVGSRQKVVILVTVAIFIFMIVAAALIWVGRGKNPIESSVVARVYVDLSAIASVLLGGALACYGLILFLKMRRVRSERASSEMWKVAGLAVVSVICFTSGALVALFTDIPMLYHWHNQHINIAVTSLLLILYYFIGSSVPSAFVLWVMRELPPSAVAHIQAETRTIAFIHDPTAPVHPQRWTAAASSQNQVSKASPI